ncbi:MAG: quinol:cytochrome C oxidoreductase [Ignavibacteria bacterium]|nr:quinol:cytochrome C oxidoreductase [Ignavibacteria bacterium]
MSSEFKIPEKKNISSKTKFLAFGLFGLGLLLSIIAFVVDSHRALANYNVIFTFLVSIAVGNLFWFAIEYLSGAVWSTVMRRVNEIFISFIPVVFVIGLLVLFNTHSIFHWAHEEAVKNDKLLQWKSPYLNEQFFTIRYFIYFLLWILFAYLVLKNSLKQDDVKDQIYSYKNSKISALFLPIFAITLTFFSIDFLMSTEPHWFSTIFGVYYFAGTALSSIAIVTLAVILLHEKGYFGDILKSDHFYNLGALLFAFINFWAYIAFSQFLLIWYANLPEETFWMIHRWEKGWEIFSFILIFGHFLIPYFSLLSQQAKSNLGRLKFMSIWILVMHYVDLYWLVMPSLYKEVVFGWIELSFVLLGIGITLLVFVFRFERIKNIIPVGDPKLKRSLEFHL